MSHEWPVRVGQAARRGDSMESLFRDVPGHRGFTSQIDSLTGNERFGNFMMWAVPRLIGAGIGGASGIGTGMGFGLGGMLDQSSPNLQTDLSTLPAGSVDKAGGLIPGTGSGEFGGADGLLASLFMAGNNRQQQQGENPAQQRPFIGGEGLI